MKVLILADYKGWVVERNTDCLIEGLKDKVEFTKRYYTELNPEQFQNECKNHDIVHYQNWDIERFINYLPEKPLIVTIRSHKYNPDIINALSKRKNTWLTVTTKTLKEALPFTIFISNGIFDQFRPDHEFTVGWAGTREGHPAGYKGFDLIKQACEELGIKFKPAIDIPFDQMPDYYRSLDCYVCASEAEGFSTDAMECMAMNVPLVTTKVGIPGELNVIHVDRSVEGIKKGIEKLYTQKQVEEYRWDKICPKYYKLYEAIDTGRSLTIQEMV
jgi:uncharacterized protein YbcV (DUF1398 family)